MIKLTIDGPKGSGKTTLARTIAKTQNLNHFYFGPDKSYHKEETQNEFIEMIRSDQEYILERGPLSDLIYLMTRGAIPTFQVNLVKGRPTVHYDWLPINLRDLVDYYKLSDLNVIFYASDVESLIENLKRRREKSGKFMTDEEERFLRIENYMYQHIIDLILIYEPELKPKMICKDISGIDYHEFYDEISMILNKGR